MKEKFLKLLRQVSESGDNQLFSRFKSFCLQNFKGNEVQTVIRELRLQASDIPVEPEDRTEVNFKPEDFNKHPKKAVVAKPSVEFVSSDDAGGVVGNPMKAMLEKSDEDLKNKFIGENGKPDIELALDFINEIRHSAGEPPIKARSFSKDFFLKFRATLEMSLKK